MQTELWPVKKETVNQCEHMFHHNLAAAHMMLHGLTLLYPLSWDKLAGS